MFRVVVKLGLSTFREEQRSCLFSNMKLRIILRETNEAVESDIMRSHIICTLHRTSLGVTKQVDEKDRTSSTMTQTRNAHQSVVKKPRRKRPFGIILEMVLKKWIMLTGLVWFSNGYGRFFL